LKARRVNMDYFESCVGRNFAFPNLLDTKSAELRAITPLKGKKRWG